MKSRALSICVSWALVVLSVAANASCRSLLIEPPPAPSASRQVVTNDFGWREIWRRSLYHLTINYDPTGVVVDGKIILPVERQGEMLLSAIDTTTGETHWTQDLVSRYGGMESITADSDQVYVSASFAIRASRVSDGKFMWATPELAAHTKVELLPVEQIGLVQAQVYDSKDGATIFDINAQDGTVKSTTTYSLVLQLKTDRMTYYTNSSFDLIGVDNQTGQPRWTIETRGGRGRPALINSKVLMFQNGAFLTSLVGVDPISGEQLWQTEENNFASNFSVISGTIYAITIEPAIVAIDAVTGQTIGRTTFSGGTLDTKHGPEYWLLANESKVFVYFHDSQELIAFERR